MSEYLMGPRRWQGAQLYQGLLERAGSLSFLWSFAESIFFFLVPDVIQSAIAVGSLKRSMWSCVCSVLGAMAGGLLMFAWGGHDSPAALRFVDAVPFIPSRMLATVHDALARDGLAAMLSGPVKGIPYKIYAVQSGALGLSWPMFAMMTLPARMPRFVLNCLAFYCIGKLLHRFFGPRPLPWIWIAFWIMNYSVYWPLQVRP